MKFNKIVLSALIAGLSLGSSGCAVFLVGGGAAAGAGAVAYIRGELKSTESASMKQALEASEAALTELGLAITVREKSDLISKFTARGAADKKVEVNLKKLSDALTEISIRVGAFGEETLSRLIMDKIHSKLPKAGT